MPARNLRDGQIDLRVDDNGGGSEGSVTVTLEEGDLAWRQRRPAQIVMDRGELDHARKAPSEAVELSFSMWYQDLVAHDSPTPYEVLTNTGDASAWLTQESDSDVWAVDVKFTASDPSGGSSEVLSFDRFVVEDIDFEEGEPSRLSVSGRAFVQPDIQPADIPGLRVHLDADKISGLSDAQAVSSWSDLSGFGNDFSEATDQPTYETSEINSLPVVRFNGTNDLLAATLNSTLPQPFTLFLVAKHSAGSVSADEHIVGGQDSGGTGHGYVKANDGTPDQVTADAGSEADIAALSSSAFVLVVAYDGASSVARYGGTQTTESPGSNNLKKLVLGANGAESGNFAGVDIAEFAVYNRKLTVAQMRMLEDYANAKWNV